MLRNLFLSLFAVVSIARAAPFVTDQASAELIADSSQIVAGESFEVALHFELQPHWHLYYQNPGSSGLPVEIDWTLPEGLTAGEIQWPAPKRIVLGSYVTYGYEDTVTFVVPITVDASYKAASAKLEAYVSWLVCKEMCLRGATTFSLELPVGGTAISADQTDLFKAAKLAQPLAVAPWELIAQLDTEDKTAVISVGGASGALPKELYFYAEAEGVIDPNAAQALEQLSADSAELSLSLDVAFQGTAVDGLKGILQSEAGSWLVNVPFITAAAPTSVGTQELIEVESGGFEQFLLNLGLPGYLALAFLGGLILNVMPCVLPVLSLKVFSLLKHSGQSKKEALAHGAAYTVGVILSFMALAGALFVLRALGERIGWGFQLQNPSFVVLLAVVFFLFGLNLMGVFEVGTRLVGADAKISQRNDVLGSFGMGVLAAVVGAPCMGPLVASVSGIAVQANEVTGLLIFGVMGLGLASPFLLLSVFPKLVAYLPKPGVWMESFKQFMGFLLMFAVLFLALVVGRQGGVDAVFAILLVLLLTGMAGWIYGRWAAPVKSKRSKGIAITLSVSLVAGAIVYGIQETKDGYANYQSEVVSESDQWSAWSTDRVEAELAAGNPVFVDFTATWCLICQANKKVALRTDSTTALFEARGIVALEADWTRYDAAITDELERFGRSGVPLYVLYSPDGQVTVLPQSLTNGIVRDVVEESLD